MGTLSADYSACEPGLLDNYAGPPSAALTHPISPRPWDPALADEMTRYQAHLGAPKTVDGTAGVFITGQQPGIFTGPLYTIYKAITAIQLAEAAARETGTPFVPVYWVGGDDHDFDEISAVHLLDKQHGAVQLRLDASPGQPPLSIFRLPVRDELHGLVEVAAQNAFGSEFAAGVAEFLHDSLAASANLSEWHARLMARLFRDTPLLIFTPELAAARRAAIPVFEREIASPLASTQALNAGGARLERAGYGAQVVKGDDSCNFFVERGDTRSRVRFVDGRFLLVDAGETFDKDGLLDLLHREPERFTANVALRCVVQQHLFPARAYVAGPGELAYWGQLKDVFALFDYPMPVVYPRTRAVLTGLKANKLRNKLGISLADLEAPLAELEEAVLRRGPRHAVMAPFEARRQALKDIVAGLQQDFDALGLSGRGGAELSRQFAAQMEQALAHLERGLLRVDEARTAALRGQLLRLSTELVPERKPQERYYTVFSWLFQHGWGLIPRLAESLDYRDFSLQEIEL